MPRERKWCKLYYDHLDLIGSYRYVDEQGEIRTVMLHHNDVILFDRIRSFEEKSQRFYMSNKRIADQLRMSEATVKTCIKRLKAVGLVSTYYERPNNGRVEGNRYIFTQSARLRQILQIRDRQRRGELPEGTVDLLFLEGERLAVDGLESNP